MINKNPNDIAGAPLGKTSPNPDSYSPDLLFPIARSTHRGLLNYQKTLPFMGVDIWNAYELSWLNLKGNLKLQLLK